MERDDISEQGPLRLDRRSFCANGARVAAALVSLPAAGSLLAACGGEESAPAPKAKPTPPAAPKPPPPAAKPTPPPPPAAPPSATGGANALVTEVASMAATVQALQYVNVSAKPDQNCANCLFYTAGDGGRGKCQLFTEGLVKEGGWCASWSAKPA